MTFNYQHYMPPREHINTVPSSCFKIADNALGGLAAAM
jgi:hypothetical protein